jgi:hypothetical protein
MEAVRFSETLVNIYQNTKRHIPEAVTLPVLSSATNNKPTGEIMLCVFFSDGSVRL